jgi:hypothetical protein
MVTSAEKNFGVRRMLDAFVVCSAAAAVAPSRSP